MNRVAFGRYRSGITIEDVNPSWDSRNPTFSWPEAEMFWPGGAVGVLSTENDMKVIDNDLPLLGHDFRIVSKNQMFGSIDSPEKEYSAIDIAYMKAVLGIIEPWQQLTPDEQADALRAIGASSAQHVVVMAEDREIEFDRRLKYMPVWDRFRNVPLVSECFDSGHLFPGKRVNELVNTMGGVINFLDALDVAKKQLQERLADPYSDFNNPGSVVNDKHMGYVTTYMRPLEYGLLPLPKEGVFMVGAEGGRRMRPVTDLDRALEEAGKQFEIDDFDIPPDYIGVPDSKGAPVTIESLRRMRIQDDYFTLKFPAARIMSTFIKAAGVPKLEKPRTYRKEHLPEARLISNLNFGEWSGDDLASCLGGCERSPYRSRIESLADLESGFLHAEGTVIEPFPAEAPSGVDQGLYTLIRRVETHLVLADRVTLKPLAEEHAFGRPIMIQDDIRANEMQWYFDAAKFRAITARANFVFGSYSDDDSLSKIMMAGQWEMDKFKPNPSLKDMPSHNLFTEEKLLKQISRDQLGYSYASLGSATSHIPSGNMDSHRFNRWAARAGLTSTNGGGGRYIMGEKLRGPAKGYLDDSYLNFLVLAIRCSVASRKEGPLKLLLDLLGMQLDPGMDFSYPHYSFGEGRFHVMNTRFMGERKHLILGPAHSVVGFIGGAGTYDEIFPALYHNLMVLHRGYGIFPGFDNTSPKKVLMVNSKIENGVGARGYWDVFRNMFTHEEWNCMGVHFFDYPEQAFEAMIGDARELGHNVEMPGKAVVFGPEPPAV